ncbi:MAG TPA: XRE family transcriptional regulator [bacterium]|nr:XRE family transcriptional regulator [bacterium]
MIGQRIRQARLAARLSLDDVVARLKGLGESISKQCLSNYEKGKRTPLPSTLILLGSALSVKPSYFMAEPQVSITWAGYRCQSRLGKRQREQIEAFAQSVAERQIYLQETLFPNELPRLPERRKVSTGDQAEQAAADLRACWELGNDPIDSLTQIIENNGGIVVKYPMGDVRFDGLSGYVNEGFPLVVVNRDVTDDRLRFDLGHELGHLVMDTEGSELKQEERLAHRFAGALLAVKDAVFHELGRQRAKISLDELALLKRKYGLSMQALVFRIRDLGIVSSYAFQAAFKEFAYRGWRKEEPVGFNGNEEPTRLEQLTLRALSEGIITPWMAEELCPGCTAGVEQEEPEPRRANLPSEFLKLPRSERSRLMAEASKMAEKAYQENPELNDFEAFGEDDLLD